jgi:ADP-ribose pyrophosphatase YjhB (NUDIX family)
MIDRLYRVAYRGAYRMMRVYWKVLRPQVHGALVAIWYQGEILLVRNSYVRYHSLPGGYVHRGETGRDAAVRELLEETGIRAAPSDLRLALDQQHDWEGKREHIEIFELDVTTQPAIEVDNREVIEAKFFSPKKALELDLFEPLRRVIEQRVARAN